jgi:hypothetical protein
MRFVGITLTLLLLLEVGGLQPATGRGRRHPVRPAADPAAKLSDRLYSLRERRRIQAILRLRLLELREAGLERVRSVIERRLPVDSLFEPTAPARQR